MKSNTQSIITEEEVCNDFSKVVQAVKEHGTAVIVSGEHEYLVMDFNREEKVAATEDVLKISEQLIQQNKKLYEELAK